MEAKTKILVVDDEVKICRNVEKILAKDDYDVSYASSTDEALEKMAKESYALLISDMQTPEGFAVVDLKRCTGCGLCWPIGHCFAITHADDATRIDADKCLGCSTCMDVCPQEAIWMVRR